MNRNPNFRRLLCAVVCVAGLSGQASAQFRDLMRSGDEALAAGDCPIALQEYARAVEEAPDDQRAAIAMAHASACGGQWRAAAGAIRRAIAIFPSARADILADRAFATLAADGRLMAILDSGLLRANRRRAVQNALSGTQQENMHVADVDGDGTSEVYMWTRPPRGDVMDLFIVRSAGGSLSATHILSVQGDSLSVEAARAGLVVVRARYGVSHGSENTFVAVHVTATSVETVWRWRASEGDYDTNATLWLTVANLDDDPTPEIIAFDSWGCGRVRLQVMDLVGEKMRSMPGARGRRRAAAAVFRPAALQGDMPAAHRVAALFPEDWEIQRSLARRNRGASNVAKEDRLSMFRNYAPARARRAVRSEFAAESSNCTQNYYFTDIP